jgi:hypothetical protein
VPRSSAPRSGPANWIACYALPANRMTEPVMQALIVHRHPEPRSFNAALTAVAARTLRQHGHQVEIADLYAEGFDPVEGPAHYCSRQEPETFFALGEQRHARRADALPADCVARSRASSGPTSWCCGFPSGGMPSRPCSRAGSIACSSMAASTPASCAMIAATSVAAGRSARSPPAHRPRRG